MNWDQIAGNWEQYAGRIKQKWGKLTNDDLTEIDGQREELVGKLREYYGWATEHAEKQIDEYCRTLKEEPVSRKARRAGA